jgi:hypothetical protein
VDGDGGGTASVVTTGTSTGAGGDGAAPPTPVPGCELLVPVGEPVILPGIWHPAVPKLVPIDSTRAGIVYQDHDVAQDVAFSQTLEGAFDTWPPVVTDAVEHVRSSSIGVDFSRLTSRADGTFGLHVGGSAGEVSGYATALHRRRHRRHLARGHRRRARDRAPRAPFRRARLGSINVGRGVPGWSQLARLVQRARGHFRSTGRLRHARLTVCWAIRPPSCTRKSVPPVLVVLARPNLLAAVPARASALRFTRPKPGESRGPHDNSIRRRHDASRP